LGAPNAYFLNLKQLKVKDISTSKKIERIRDLASMKQFMCPHFHTPWEIITNFGYSAQHVIVWNLVAHPTSAADDVSTYPKEKNPQPIHTTWPCTVFMA
jgi:hypothetical protein